MTAFEVKYRPVIVYADTFADLVSIPADLSSAKYAFILDTGKEYILPPKGGEWEEVKNEVIEIAEQSAAAAAASAAAAAESARTLTIDPTLS